MTKFSPGDLREEALARILVDWETGDALGSDLHPLSVVVGEQTDPDPFTYGELQTSAFGNGAPAEIVPANAARRALILTNCSDTTAYVSFGDGTGLSATAYALRFYPGQTIILEPPDTQQAISGMVAAGAGKLAGWQEAT